MPEITPLICTVCGSKLTPTTDLDRYACSHCGTEYLTTRDIASAPVRTQPQTNTNPLQKFWQKITSKTPNAQPPKSKRSAASVLLELFDYVPDAGKLDKLLEPASILKLTLLYGWKEDDLKQQLQGGKLPGELLLELLKLEPDPDVLIARLDDPKKY